MPDIVVRGPSEQRRLWAFAVALTADALQWVLLPLVWAGAVSPVDDLIDVVVAVALTWLIGWHFAFLPSFLTKLIPVVDFVPTWTLAVWVASRGRKAPREVPLETPPRELPPA